jgi:aspartate/methionine/tyrosine aminotransferase
MFSSRVPSSLELNAMSRALRAARLASRPLIDLTIANPTKAGFDYPGTLLAPLQAPDALVYEPVPFGAWPAREAAAQDYGRRGVAVSPDRIVLTSSTSEAYSLLFKLLCDSSADAVLVPVPSYPLFEHLTRLDGVVPVPYALEYQGRWVLDYGSVEAAWTPRTRAVLAVSPNNPTGSCLSRAEADWLSSTCAARGAALIIDEVFADYPLAMASPESGTSISNPRDVPPPCLTFRLGGLSKSAGLPQIKLGWIAVEGPGTAVQEALARLEFICDAYLSVSTPVQVAAPSLITHGRSVRAQIAARIGANHDRLRHLASSHPSIEVLTADAGWSAVIRVPARKTEEEVVLELLERDGVVVHPGFFFDFPHEAFLILSLLPPPAMFEAGVTRLVERVTR